MLQYVSILLFPISVVTSKSREEIERNEKGMMDRRKERGIEWAERKICEALNRKFRFV